MKEIKINGILYSPEEIRSLLADVKSLSKLEEWERKIFIFLENWFDSSGSIKQLTSGTTGKPKLLHLKKKAMLHSAKITCDFFNLSSESNALLCLSVDYIAGKMMIIRALYSHLNLITVPPDSDPHRHVKTKIDFVAMVPLQVRSMMDLYHKNFTVKTLLIGGAEIPFQLEKRLRAIRDTEIFASYGMTETCSHIALRKVNGPGASPFFSTLPGITINVDTRNCLKIEAPRLLEDPIVTNDIVEIMSHGKFLWKGRFDNLINSGGIKISPENIEDQLKEDITKKFIVSSLPDKLLGEKIVLVIESEPLTESEHKTLVQKINQKLEKYTRPKEIVAVKKIPQINSKPDRRKLKKMLMSAS
ncbi:MAG: AMP-binding protein [Bacteroidales bacterium]|nr:AMP-binding protein [Bacteroidales bacterium]